MRRISNLFPFLPALCGLLLAAPLWAKNLDLATVPGRQTVQLTIYNSEDLTLVKETRRLAFKQGINPLQFSWANTLIDPTSVELHFRSHGDRLAVLDTSFPHDKPQMLYWNVRADADLEAEIEISYFTSGISWSADYVAIAEPQETQLALQGFVRVTNRSGEEYEEAQVRLVVGEINLVEKIAELAQRPVSQVKEMKRDEYDQLRQRVARKAMAEEAMPAPMLAGAVMAPSPAPKAIEKEGLGEYFIYTIEGTETIPDGWSKRLRSFQAGAVPMQVEYRYRPSEYGDLLVRLYLLKNDKASGLGITPIPDGEVRVFRQDGPKGLRYLAAQNIKYVPIGDKLELNLGKDPEVVFELVKRRVFRDNLWLRYEQGNVYKKVDDATIQVDHKASVAGWDEHQLFTQRIRNYSGRPIQVEVERAFDGDVVFKSRLNPERRDYRTLRYRVSLPAGEKAGLEYEVLTRNGYNAKQNRVEFAGG